jgi:hypothetical protein
MDFELNAHVYCHDLLNPPAPNRDVNITLELKNQKVIELTKVAPLSSESVYSLVIKDPQSMGFRSNGTSTFKTQFDNLLLAFNLLLPRVCVSIQSPRFSSFDKRYKVPKSTSKSVVVRTDHKVLVNVTEEHLLLTEKAHAAIFLKGSLDELALIDIFRRLQSLNRAAINNYSPKADYNLKKSLERYERAMHSFEKESAFKDLFTSLEKITNARGKRLEGSDFDRRASVLSGTQIVDIETWRLLNNRFKHPAKNRKDIKTLEEEEAESLTMLTDVRKCVQSIIHSNI